MTCSRLVPGAAWWAMAATLVLGGRWGLGAEEPLDVGRLAGIRLAEPAAALERTAAQDLGGAMKKLFGLSLPILKDDAAADGPTIVLGAAAVASGRVSRKELDALPNGGYVVRCDGQGIAIAGPDPSGTLFGAYAFLERLGVRFFSPWMQDAVFPKDAPRQVGPLAFSERPAFEYRAGRSLLWRQTYSFLGEPKNGLNPELFDEKKTGSDLWVDHSAGYLVPKLLYYDQHPEYYAMLKDGARVAKDRFTDHRTPLCLSNPDVVRIASERALGWIEREPGKRFFMITYGDTGTWCQCPACLAFDPAPGQYATRLLAWVNPIARAVAARFPDRVLFTFAYGGTDVAPPKARPEPKVWIIGSTGLGNVPFWDHAFARKAPELDHNLQKIDGWLAIVPDRFMVCEYLAGTYRPALVDTMASRLRYYAKRGLRGIWTTYGRPANFTALWEFLFARMMWDPQQDPQPLADDFIRHTYGEAAEPILAFFRLSRERYAETLKSGAEVKRLYPVGYYERAFAEQAAGHLEQARQIAARLADALDYGKDHRQSKYCGCPKCRATRLAAEVANEQRLFLLDWMEHPTASRLDEAARAVLDSQLTRLLALAGDSPEAKAELSRAASQLAVRLDAILPGTREAVMDWLRRSNPLKPGGQKTADGVLLSAQDFVYAGLGPETYGHLCPPKVAVAIYVKGNSMGRSESMEAAFDLDEVPGDGAATLEIEGQDCDHDVPPADLRIEVNGAKVFEGQASVVKRNWSKQSFAIPAGVLKKGTNKLRFENVTPPESVKQWYERWFMLSAAQVRFAPKK